MDKHFKYLLIPECHLKKQQTIVLLNNRFREQKEETLTSFIDPTTKLILPILEKDIFLTKKTFKNDIKKNQRMIFYNGFIFQ